MVNVVAAATDPGRRNGVWCFSIDQLINSSLRASATIGAWVDDFAEATGEGLMKQAREAAQQK